MSEKYINTPVTEQDIESLETGDMVYISGTIYTARDAAHKRLYEAIQAHQEIPVELKDNIIYYLGPSPAREGQVMQVLLPAAVWTNIPLLCWSMA